MSINFLRKSYNIDFIVNEDNGTVVAKIADPDHIPKVLFNILAAVPKELGVGHISFIINYCKRLKSMRGVAKCDPKDTFDVNTGKKIAFLKLRKKYNNYLWKIVRKFNEFYLDRAFELNEFAKELEDMYDEDSDKLDKYGTAAEDNYPN